MRVQDLIDQQFKTALLLGHLYGGLQALEEDLCREDISMATQHKFYEIRQELYLFIRDNIYDIEDLGDANTLP
jgi:hypothetical protein